MIFVHGGRSDCELDDCGHVWGERECRGNNLGIRSFIGGKGIVGV